MGTSIAVKISQVKFKKDLVFYISGALSLNEYGLSPMAGDKI
jgi:hypothetical protein